MHFGDKLKQLRVLRGWSQEELAQRLETSKQVISRYENGQRIPRIDVVQRYAALLNVPLASFIDDNLDPLTPETGRAVPLIGTIACGMPILADENIESYVALPDEVQADFCLRCRGDSMIGARICDGDIVFIRRQPDVQDGQIAAVLIDEEATLKRVYKIGRDRVELRAENPTFPVLRYEGEALRQMMILGRAVFALTRIQ